MPEIWSRMRAEEKTAKFLLHHEYLEKLNDFVNNGEIVLQSRLGYRITAKFARVYLGRVFENPDAVFNEDMIKPELQSMDVYVDGINNIIEAQQKVAKTYFNDGSIHAACLPLKALLNIMVEGNYNGKTIDDPEIRKMFTREYLLESEWYQERLFNKQLLDISLWQNHVVYLTKYINSSIHLNDVEIQELKDKLRSAEQQLKIVKLPSYLKSLNGYIGLDPLGKN